MAQGYLALALHAHLPYVRHPEHPSFHEEAWLFEAIGETYLPLLQAFERLLADRVPFRVTLSLSPTLTSMLQDALLQDRFRAHLGRLLRLAKDEVQRTRHDPLFAPLARFYLQRTQHTQDLYERHYQGDLLARFGRLREAGVLELMPSTATHGYLPLLRTEPSAVRAQLRAAAASHRRTFGVHAEGIWLPECGYYPGLDAPLREAGFRYVTLETHGLLDADPAPRAGVYAPVTSPAGVAAFARDPECAQQVWSAQVGYPRGAWYRDFYRDVGFDRALEDLAAYLPDGRTRTYTGLKYFRVTGGTGDKQPYDPAAAYRQAKRDAEDFVQRRLQAANALAPLLAAPPIMVAPYDAELFGHWWFEGPAWLEAVIRAVHATSGRLELVTLGDYLARHGAPQHASPAASSWGSEGYSAFWLNEGNDWIYPHLHRAARRMHEAATVARDAPPGALRERALRQAGRALLLAQASDWPFIMKTATAVDYAERQVKEHLARFHYLEQGLRSGELDEARLRALEYVDAVFPELDFRVFA